jgi:choline monooxygenase
MDQAMTTYTLDSAYYTDPAIALRERAAIFDRNWTLAVPAVCLPQPGDYHAATINGWPLLMMRGEDGVIRGFLNVCVHRGAALVPEGAGHATVLMCPYHAWTYGLDGRLRGTPRFGDGAALGSATAGLTQVRTAIWQGLVFVCLDPAAPELLDWLGDLPAIFDRFDNGGMAYHGSYAIEGRANWKTYCDNTVEGYHLATVHPRLSQAVERGTEITARNDGRLILFDVRYRGAGASLRGAEGVWFYLFPGFQGVLGATGFKAERIEAVGAGTTRSTGWHWYRDLPAEDCIDAFAWAQQIVREDLEICESVQRNMEAGAFRRGVLSPAQEQHTARLQDIVREALGEPTLAANARR